MRARVRGVAERIADLAVRTTGGLRVARWLDARDRPALRVLVYHRVVDPADDPLAGDPGIISATPDAFDAHIRIIASHYEPVGVDAVVAMLSDGAALPRRAVLITFDDGYRDIKTHAWPVLKRYGVPAVVFVPTAFPDQATRFWWDEVWQMLVRTPQTRVSLDDGDSVSLASPQARLIAHRRIVRVLRPLPPDLLQERLRSLRASLGEVSGPPPVLGWDDLRSMARDGLAVASHGRTHASLPALSDAELADEIDGAERDLTRELGASPRIFAYPFGHFDSRVAALLRARSYVGALSTIPGRNPLPLSEPLAIRRQSVNVAHSSSRIQLGLAGFYPGAWSRLRSKYVARGDPRSVR